MDRKDLEIHESPAVIKHLEFLQDIISRMAANSTTCKKWTLTIVTAIAALLYSEGSYIFLALIPVVFFYIMDSIYLGLEKSYRDLHVEFIRTLNDGTLQKEDFYTLKFERNLSSYLKCFCYGARSFSTLVFYLSIAMIVVVLFIVASNVDVPHERPYL